MNLIFYILILLFYKLEYHDLNDQELFHKKGYYLLYRKWLWIIFSPFIFPVKLMFNGPKEFNYFKNLNKWSNKCLDIKEQKLSISEKIEIRVLLLFIRQNQNPIEVYIKNINEKLLKKLRES